MVQPIILIVFLDNIYVHTMFSAVYTYCANDQNSVSTYQILHLVTYIAFFSVASYLFSNARLVFSHSCFLNERLEMARYPKQNFIYQFVRLRAKIRMPAGLMSGESPVCCNDGTLYPHRTRVSVVLLSGRIAKQKP